MTTTTPPFEPATLPLIEMPADDAARVPGLPRRPFLDLFLVSFLILFYELAAIRWFGSTVVFLTFFTNIVLLATFLGMSIGLLTASRRQHFIHWVLPLSFFAVAMALLTFNLYIKMIIFNGLPEIIFQVRQFNIMCCNNSHRFFSD